jgi:hypothetical protein
MRKASFFMVLIVGAGIGMAAAETAVPAAPAASSDSFQAAGTAPCPAMGMGHKGWGMMRGPWEGRHWDGAGPMGPGCANPMFQNCPGFRHGFAGSMHPHAFFLAKKLVHAAFLALLLVNILLTILVGLDMAKRARFNGLWIAIVLIGGLPASAVYALFRIGDGIAEAKRA